MTIHQLGSISETPAGEGPLTQPGARLFRAATSDRGRAVAQALAEERTILAVHRVESALLVERGHGTVLHWEGLRGKLYTLPLDPEQRAFLGLILSMVGMGQVAITAVTDLNTERLRIIVQALLRLAGDDSIAIATRI
ncbi:hypothetical protein ACFWM5_01350 [Streptomyces bobili]|uniref:hypothetical protein n=1 Tax=Streptomyces bobili TaxID=67280 RepID=UPI003665A329